MKLSTLKEFCWVIKELTLMLFRGRIDRLIGVLLLCTGYVLVGIILDPLLSLGLLLIVLGHKILK